jgi:hypothetical protein
MQCMSIKYQEEKIIFVTSLLGFCDSVFWAQDVCENVFMLFCTCGRSIGKAVYGTS